MMLTSVDNAGTFPEPSFERQLDIPWDDPYPYYAGMIPSEPPEDDPMRCSEEDNANDDDASQLSVIKEGEFTVLQVPFCYSSNDEYFPVLNSLDVWQEGHPEHVTAILKAIQATQLILQRLIKRPFNQKLKLLAATAAATTTATAFS